MASGSARKALQRQRAAVLLSAGSFSPPTLMHLISLEQAREYVETTFRQQVLKGFLSPVHDAYGKAGLVSASHRLEMCSLAVRDSDWLAVDAWEAQQTTYTPTYGVVRSLRERLEAKRTPDDPDLTIYFVCGADLVASMDSPQCWPEEHLQRLFALCRVLALPRPGLGAMEGARLERVLHRFPDSIFLWRDAPIQCNISSTLLRKRIAERRSIHFLTPRPVEEYIRKHELYHDFQADSFGDQ
jgi:nicotinamide mononucleotide adenylyltransferase